MHQQEGDEIEPSPIALTQCEVGRNDLQLAAELPRQLRDPGLDAGLLEQLSRCRPPHQASVCGRGAKGRRHLAVG